MSEYVDHEGRTKHPHPRDKEANRGLSMETMEGGQSTHTLETRKQMDV